MIFTDLLFHFAEEKLLIQLLYFFMSWEFAGIMRGITSAVSWSTQRHILVNRH